MDKTNLDLFKEYYKQNTKVINVLGYIALAFLAITLPSIILYAFTKGTVSFIILVASISFCMGFATVYLVAKTAFKNNCKFIETVVDGSNIACFSIPTTNTRTHSHKILVLSVNGKEIKKEISSAASPSKKGVGSSKYDVPFLIADYVTYLRKKSKEIKNHNNIIHLKAKYKEHNISLIYDIYKHNLALMVNDELFDV